MIGDPVTTDRWRGRQPSADRFNVLVLCRANHCRSPLMEFLLREQVVLRNLNWTVTSAGTEAVDGWAMHQYSAQILGDRGLRTTGWVSRRLTDDLLADAHLVLTATQDQRELVETLQPALVGSTFTLLHLAHLARSTHPDRMLAAVELGPWLLQESYRRRKWMERTPENQRDLEDPLGRPPNRFRGCANVIGEAYADILAGGPVALSGRRR